MAQASPPARAHCLSFALPIDSRASASLFPARSGEGMRCAACGRETQPGRRFCAECGAALRGDLRGLRLRQRSGGQILRRLRHRACCRGQGLAEAPAADVARRRAAPAHPPVLRSLPVDGAQRPARPGGHARGARRLSQALRRRPGPLWRHGRLLHGRRHPGLLRLPDGARGRRRAGGARGPGDRAGGRQPRPELARPLPLPLQVRIAIHTGLVVAGEIGVDSGAASSGRSARPPTSPPACRCWPTPGHDRRQRGDATACCTAAVRRPPRSGGTSCAGIGETIEVFRVESERRLAPVIDADAAAATVALVNREAELGAPREAWDTVQRGGGQAVLLSGEPGHRQVAAGARRDAAPGGDGHQVILLLRSSPYFSDSPLHPVIELIERSAAIPKDGTAERRLERLERHVGSLRERLPDLVEVLADLLGIAQTRYSALAAWRRPSGGPHPGRLCEYVLALAASSPAVIVFEDLHWADPTTREWLGLLLDRLHRGAVACPDCRCGPTTERLGRPAGVLHVAARPAQPRGERGDRRPAHSRAPASTRAAGTDPRRHRRRAAVRRGADQGAGRSRSRHRRRPARSPAVVIPATIQDSLTARLDRLGEAKQVAQVAATIGREFARELLGRRRRAARPPPSKPSLSRLVEFRARAPLGASGSSSLQACARSRRRLRRPAPQPPGARSTPSIVEVLEPFPALVAASPELAAQHSVAARPTTRPRTTGCRPGAGGRRARPTSRR